MLPVSLDLARLRVVLVGDGAAGLRRLALLHEASATKLTVYAPRPNAEWLNAAGPRLVGDVPRAEDFAGAAIVFLAGLDDTRTIELAAAARQAGALVHAEDRLDLTDLHIPAVVRRGDLTLAVSTNGQSPALARLLKRHLAALFGPAWSARVREIGSWRRRWREQGLAPTAIAARTEDLVEAKGWLDPAPAGVVPALDGRHAADLNH
jgi:precorrin-2 dehydrogenase/sirohydrochlorin ferrochelatase